VIAVFPYANFACLVIPRIRIGRRAPGPTPDGTHEVSYHPDQGAREDDRTDAHHGEPYGAAVRQDVDGGEPVCDRMRCRRAPGGPRGPHQPPVSEEDDARKPGEPPASPGDEQLVDNGEAEEKALEHCQAESEPQEQEAQVRSCGTAPIVFRYFETGLCIQARTPYRATSRSRQVL